MSQLFSYREKITVDANTQYRLRTVVLLKNDEMESPLIVTGSSDGYIQVGNRTIHRLVFMLIDSCGMSMRRRRNYLTN